MGYASTLENSYERLCESVDRIERVVKSTIIPTGEHYDAICAALHECRALLPQVYRYAELLTDPETDVFDDLAQTQELNRRLRTKLVALETRNSRLEAEAAAMAKKLSEQWAELQHWRNEANRLAREFESALRKFPAAAYELYSPTIQKFEG
jgi:chromosome segregation ATPase